MKNFGNSLCLKIKTRVLVLPKQALMSPEGSQATPGAAQGVTQDVPNITKVVGNQVTFKTAEVP